MLLRNSASSASQKRGARRGLPPQIVAGGTFGDAPASLRWPTAPGPPRLTFAGVFVQGGVMLLGKQGSFMPPQPSQLQPHLFSPSLRNKAAPGRSRGPPRLSAHPTQLLAGGSAVLSAE